MGLAASNARFLFLTGYKSDLEFKMQQICQARMDLAMRSGNISIFYNNLISQLSQSIQSSTDQNKVNQVNTQITNYNSQCTNSLVPIQAADKNLEMQQKQVETQHTAVQTELESCKKVIDKDIEFSFKYFA